MVLIAHSQLKVHAYWHVYTALIYWCRLPGVTHAAGQPLCPASPGVSAARPRLPSSTLAKRQKHIKHLRWLAQRSAEMNAWQAALKSEKASLRYLTEISPRSPLAHAEHADARGDR